MVQFIANNVVVVDSDACSFFVGFINEQGGVFHDALHFRRYLDDFDEHDVEPSKNCIYAQRRWQDQGGYGGVERVELHPGRVRVVVGGEVAERMGDREFEIAFVVPPEEFESLRAGLRVVFAGFDTLREYAA
jgi:hypothetical protein